MSDKRGNDIDMLIISGVSMLLGGVIVVGVFIVCGPEVALFGDALVCHGEWQRLNT